MALMTSTQVVCYTAVFIVVTQRSSPLRRSRLQTFTVWMNIVVHVEKSRK